MYGRDVAEFIIAGAMSVQVGTANLISPDATKRILKEFSRYMEVNDINNVRTLIGTLIV